MLKTLFSIGTQPVYFLVGAVTGFVVMTVAVMFSNWQLLYQIILDGSIAWQDKAGLFFSLYLSVFTNFTGFDFFLTLLTALLFGGYVMLFVYFVRSRKVAASGGASAASLGGLIAGFLGMGCAACGSFVLSSLLGIAGAGALLAWLPLGGSEFLLLSIALIILANYRLVKKIQSPLVCDPSE